MRSQVVVRIALLALLLTASASAQTLSFGEPFPLTNTRYGVESSSPVLVSNGPDVFAFWQTDTNIRMTRLVEGERRGGRNAFRGGAATYPWSVTWTGKHFLVAVADMNGVSGQLLTATGESVSAPFDIATTSGLARPRLASNGSTVLLLYSDSGALHRVTMTASGEVTGRSVLFDRPSNVPRTHAVASNGRGFAAIAMNGGDVSTLTFDAQGEEISRRLVHLGSSPYASAPVTIASDNERYLVAWQASGQGTHAAALTSHGSLEGSLLVEPLDTTSLSSMWTGSEWAIAYAQAGQNARMRIAYVDSAFRSVLRREEIAGAAYASIAAANGRAFAVWRPSAQAAPVASTLPLGSSEPWFAAYAATKQSVLTATSSATATLVAWYETLDGVTETRVGVRHEDGRWFERSLGADAPVRSAFAASDGRDFAVVLRRHHGETSTVVFLDERARVTASAVELPIEATGIAWNDSGYLVAGDGTGGAHIVRVTHSGASAAVLVAPEKEAMAIAASGDRVLVTVLDPDWCQITCPGVFGWVMYVRLNASLTPVEAPQRVSREEGRVEHATATWDGRDFVVAWVDDERIHFEVVPSAGPSLMTSSFPARPDNEGLQLIRAAEGSILSWREETSSGRNVLRIATLTAAAFPSIQTLEMGWIYRHAVLVPLSGGRLGHVTVRPNFDAPHHGSPRVFMQIGSVAPPELPTAPAMSALHARGRIRLTWTPPTERVNGYRVEYRIGDGSWHELDEWFDADDLATTLTWNVRPGVAYSFRVRAFRDVGVTEYSVPVTVNLTKRRSVR